MAQQVESDDGLHHEFRQRTKKTFKQFKKDATIELSVTWTSFLVWHEWHDRILQISSFGAHGTATLDGDVIVCVLDFDSWPATFRWVKDRMIHDVRRMTDAVAEYSNLQAEES